MSQWLSLLLVPHPLIIHLASLAALVLTTVRPWRSWAAVVTCIMHDVPPAALYFFAPSQQYKGFLGLIFSQFSSLHLVLLASLGVTITRQTPSKHIHPHSPQPLLLALLLVPEAILRTSSLSVSNAVLCISFPFQKINPAVCYLFPGAPRLLFTIFTLKRLTFKNIDQECFNFYSFFSTCGTAAACGHLWGCPLSKPRTWGSWLPWSLRLCLAFKKTTVFALALPGVVFSVVTALQPFKGYF